jgi:hypothetical protein
VGLPLSSERASDGPGIKPASRVPRPPQPAVRIGRRTLFVCRAFLSFLAAVGCVAAGQVNFGSTVRAIAQMKPTNSRAIATTTLGVGLPAATSLR